MTRLSALGMIMLGLEKAREGDRRENEERWEMRRREIQVGRLVKLEHEIPRQDHTLMISGLSHFYLFYQTILSLPFLLYQLDEKWLI